MTVASLDSPRVDSHNLFRTHRNYVWGLCYRMTGSVADADDLTQDTFTRVLEKPPRDVERDLRPWLRRVAMNLSRDALRRRRRRKYVGPWLPAPIEDTLREPPSSEVATPGGDTAGRYELLESVSFAFLLALEALTPAQRAVLLLRDAFDHSVRETAEALGMSESNVKTTLHRARKRMEGYRQERRDAPPRGEVPARAREALGKLLAALAMDDRAALDDLVAEEARAWTDGGGEFFAALKPLIGRDRVIRFFTKLAQRRLDATAVALTSINGEPAVKFTSQGRDPREASHVLLRCEVDAAGRIKAIHSVLATAKLRGVRFDD